MNTSPGDWLVPAKINSSGPRNEAVTWTQECADGQSGIYLSQMSCGQTPRDLSDAGHFLNRFLQPLGVDNMWLDN